jgi:hypothetical protein
MLVNIFLIYKRLRYYLGLRVHMLQRKILVWRCWLGEGLQLSNQRDVAAGIEEQLGEERRQLWLRREVAQRRCLLK